MKDSFFLKNETYFDILYVIIWADQNKKEITLPHLSYIFVKNNGYSSNKKIKKNKKQKMEDFFKGLDKKYRNIIESKKITTVNNLNTNYLKKLSKFCFLEPIKMSERKTSYKPLPKCMILINQYLLHEQIDMFFNVYMPEIYNNKKYTAGTAKASFELDEIITKATAYLYNKYKNRSKKK